MMAYAPKNSNDQRPLSAERLTQHKPRAESGRDSTTYVDTGNSPAAHYLHNSRKGYGDGRLITSLPGLSRSTIALIIVGAVAREVDCPKSHLDILFALLSHGGYHGNRIWASAFRLATLASREATSDGKKAVSHCTKTAERAMRFWASIGAVRVITDQEELLSGPGEHDYVDAGKKKKGEGPTNHYDVTGLLAFLPGDLCHLLDVLAVGTPVRLPALPAAQSVRDLDLLYPDPFVKPAAPSVPILDPEEDDPFAEDTGDRDATASTPPPSKEPPRPLSAELSQIRSEIAASLSLSGISTKNINIETTSHPKLPQKLPEEPCDVESDVINNEGEEAPRGLASRAQPAPRPSCFTRTNLSDISNKYPHVHEGRTDTKDTSLLSRLTRSRANGGYGFDLPGANKLVVSNSEAFLKDLLEYTRWREGIDGDVKGPGWITNTAKKLQSGEWPAEFRQHLDRLKRRGQQGQQHQQAERTPECTTARAPERAPTQQTDQLEGVEEPLRGIWPQLKIKLQEDCGIKHPYWAMHIKPLRGATIRQSTGDDGPEIVTVVTIEASNKFSYERLTLDHTDTFTRLLTQLLGRSVRVVFSYDTGAG